jgi:hypothetical protein
LTALKGFKTTTAGCGDSFLTDGAQAGCGPALIAFFGVSCRLWVVGADADTVGGCAMDFAKLGDLTSSGFEPKGDLSR